MNMTPIADILNTPEGRKALAEAMTEPIRKHLEYQAIGTKVLLIDEFPNSPQQTEVPYNAPCPYSDYRAVDLEDLDFD